MTSRSRLVMEPQQRVQLFQELIVEFSALVCDDLEREPELKNSTIKDGRCEGEGYFVGEGNELDVIGKCIGHA